MTWRLGLDLGTNSIGWAALALDGKETASGLIDLGGTIFPDRMTGIRDQRAEEPLRDPALRSRSVRQPRQP